MGEEHGAELPALVLVGASAGGLGVLRRLLSDLPADLPAAVLAVVHLPSRPTSSLVELVRDSCAMPAAEVAGPRRLQRGKVLVAPPDRRVQDPGEAVLPGMPASAVEATHVHDVVPAAALGAEVARLVRDVLAVGA